MILLFSLHACSGEDALRASGQPYTVVRPSGLASGLPGDVTFVTGACVRACAMGQCLGRLAGSVKVQLTPRPQQRACVYVLHNAHVPVLPSLGRSILKKADRAIHLAPGRRVASSLYAGCYLLCFYSPCSS